MSSEIIENIYHTFGNVPKPTKILGCTHCCTTEVELQDLERGVQNASTSAVKTLAENGINLVGSEDDYKYFLPRILYEMYLDEDFYKPCIDSLTLRIKQAGFDSWDAEQRKSVVKGLCIVFSKRFENGMSWIDLEDWMYGIACAGFDIRLFLNVLDKPEHEFRKNEFISNSNF